MGGIMPQQESQGTPSDMALRMLEGDQYGSDDPIDVMRQCIMNLEAKVLPEIPEVKGVIQELRNIVADQDDQRILKGE